MTLHDPISPSALSDLMLDIGAQARAAASVLSKAPAQQKTDSLHAMAAALRDGTDAVLAANADDVSAATEAGIAAAFVDRLRLDPVRIEGIAASLEAIAAMDDPIGATLAEWDRPNGLKISRVRTPLGVIGIIYESRPNVTADAGALCLKSGNACVLRSGSDAIRSATAIHVCLQQGLKALGLPEAAIQLVPTTDRSAVGEMLKGLGGTVDVIVPRGGKALVSRVQEEARVPVFAHLEGLCHAYVDRTADPAKTIDIVVNAKMRRTGICGALETLLIHKDVAAELLPVISEPLIAAGCELRGDIAARNLVSGMQEATEADWRTEYLDQILSVRVVESLQAAMDHICEYGSGHTETIITEDRSTADRFLNEVDSAIVMHNASTQFADGGEFGMGAEIGIATGRIHARGPVGAEQLTTFKYIVRGNGQTRP
ncbi:MAG: glutamate-5-semialdehyde dehydrogenase [Pseudomonadota bacterium]